MSTESDPPERAEEILGSADFKRKRARKPTGVARFREPVKDKETGLWRARYVDLEGVVRQCGRFRTKGAAREESTRVVAQFNAAGPSMPVTPTFLAFLEDWPTRFPRHPRTAKTNAERINAYVVPFLPRQGRVALNEIRRADLRAVQGRLLDRRLAKSTIDGALSAVSALFRDAKDIELIETNPASALRVRPNDPRLNPVRGPVQRRALPPQEVRAFIAAVPGRWRAACWMPALTGCRPAELFAANLKHVDRERQMIYLHQTVDRYGHLMNGLKGTHHVQDIDMRGRWTLFPHVLLEMFADAPTALDGTLVPSPRGKLWSIRNWYRNVWDPAVKASGVQAFTLYDLRHSFSSWLQAAGIPSLEVSGWMGHSLRAGGVDLVTTTTRIYSHATGQWRERALNELTAVVRGEQSSPGRRTSSN